MPALWGRMAGRHLQGVEHQVGAHAARRPGPAWWSGRASRPSPAQLDALSGALRAMRDCSVAVDQREQRRSTSYAPCVVRGRLWMVRAAAHLARRMPEDRGTATTAWQLAGSGAANLWGARSRCGSATWVDRWGRRSGMIVARVVAPALPDVRPDRRLAGLAYPLECVQGRRAPRVRSRGCGSAAGEPEAAPGLGRPGGPGRVDPAATEATQGPPAGGPGDGSLLAPARGRPEVDLPEPDRRPAAARRGRRADRAVRPGQCLMGLPADPGRAGQARPPGCGLDDPPDPRSPSAPNSPTER
jgi:hypothetical protein